MEELNTAAVFVKYKQFKDRLYVNYGDAVLMAISVIFLSLLLMCRIFMYFFLQFADGVYLVLLMGLLEGYFVPLYNFYLTPENFEQKVWICKFPICFIHFIDMWLFQMNKYSASTLFFFFFFNNHRFAGQTRNEVRRVLNW